MDNTNFEDLVHEIKHFSDKTVKILTKTRRLIDTLDDQTRIVVEHMDRIKKILGVDNKRCPVCMSSVNTPNFCVDPCHHMFCGSCSSKCLRPPSKCFICRQPVVARFKVFI
jgi:hypothetical protein